MSMEVYISVEQKSGANAGAKVTFDILNTWNIVDDMPVTSISLPEETSEMTQKIKLTGNEAQMTFQAYVQESPESYVSGVSERVTDPYELVKWLLDNFEYAQTGDVYEAKLVRGSDDIVVFEGSLTNMSFAASVDDPLAVVMDFKFERGQVELG